MAEHVTTDMPFQRHEWRWQRVGWGFMGAIVIAALLGLLGGPGPLNSTTWADARGDVHAEGYSVERRHRDSQLTLYINQQVPVGDVLYVRISREYLAKVQVHVVTPEPSEVRFVGDHYQMKFAVDAQKPAPRQIVMFLEHEAIGPVTADIAVSGGSGEERHLSIKQFSLP